MTVVFLSFINVQPGRDAEWLSTTDDFRAQVRRLGGRKPFVIINQQYAGSGTGQYITRTEFDNVAALGDYVAIRDRDPRMREMLAQAEGADFPARLVGQAIYTVVLEAGDSSDEHPGTVYWRRSWRVKPGRIDGILTLSEGSANHAIRHGARGFRAMRADVAGPQTGIYSTFTRFDDMAAFGRYLDLAQHDPEIQQLIARASEPDAPADSLGQGIGVVVQS